MQKLTPDWAVVARQLINTLDEIADDLDFKLSDEEDPATAVDEALTDLDLFLGAIKDDPGQFSMRDVS